MQSNTKYITATGLVRTGEGKVMGVIVSSHSSGTLKLEDSVGGGQDLLVNTYTFATGSQIITFPKPIHFFNGLYATLGGSNNKLTFVFLDAEAE